MTHTKVCSRCDKEKPLDDFYRRRKGQPQRQSVCKRCTKAQRIKYDRADPRKRMLRSARYRARKKRIPFSLTIDDIAIPERCPVFNQPLRHNWGKRNPTDWSPTLDRIIPGLGYVPGNVVVVSMKANRIKNMAVPHELRQVARYYERIFSGKPPSGTEGTR